MITVVTPAGDRNLIELADLKLELGVTSTDDDTWLAAVIAQASAAVESFCDRVFAVETVDETLPGDGTPFLILSRAPVTALTSVKYGPPASQETIDPATYMLHDNRLGIVANLNGTWRDTSSPIVQQLGFTSGGFGMNYYTVRYSSGFATIPADVQRAVTDLCKTSYYRRADDPSLASIDVPDVIRKSWRAGGEASAGGLPASVAGLLQPYRRAI